MTRLRMKLGTYDTDLTEEEFDASLRAWLQARGTISEISGRGLVISRHSVQGRPGNIGLVILGLVRDKPGITEAQLNRKLGGEYSPMQVKNGIRRLIRAEELRGARVSTGTKHFTYTISTKGEEKLDAFLQADRMAKQLAVRVWAGVKTLGYKDGSMVDYEELLGITELTTVEMSAGFGVLIKLGKLRAEGTTDSGHTQYWAVK